MKGENDQGCDGDVGAGVKSDVLWGSEVLEWGVDLFGGGSHGDDQLARATW